MATTQGIRSAVRAVATLLQDSFDATQFNGIALDFDVIDSEAFAGGLPTGCGVFCYRVEINATHRLPPGRVDPATGVRRRNRLPVDLRLLLVVSAKPVATQHAVAGWAMRTLEDFPVLPPGLLNRSVPGVFAQDESIDLSFDEIAHEEILHLWETLGANHTLTVPYVIRNLFLESSRDVELHPEVQERLLRHGVLADPPLVAQP